MRKCILVITLLFAIGTISKVFAQPVSYDDAMLIATKSFGEMFSLSTKSVVVAEEYYVKTLNSEPVYYVFNKSDGGYVIVSGELKTVPILAYSYDGFADVSNPESNPEFMWWMQIYEDQINYIRENNISAVPEAGILRAKLENGEDIGLRPAKDVAPLMATTWNQGCGYNAQCPVDAAGPCSRVYTGCVATAMAQVIRYMEYPVNGTGDKCYYHYVYGDQCADFAAATYDYSIMPNGSGNAEVAELMYHCGVSVSMSYSPTGSGAYSHNVVTALKDYFGYKNVVILNKGSYTDDNWNSILRHEIDNNRPMYYSGSGGSGGHAFVFDGYQGLDFFHINWGWGGSYNGYFYCNDLTPGSYSFTNGQNAIIGTIPAPLFTNLDVSSAVELSCATPINQDLLTGNDYINYYKNTYPVTPGKELVYHFTTTLPGRIRVKITNSTEGNLNAFLLSYPHQDSLITYGTNGFILDDTEPGTYWLAVESSEAAEPQFDIEVICPTIDAEIIITDGNITPQFIESDQTNVSFNCSVKNIGNTAAGTSDIEYFLSDDMVFDFGTDIYLGTDIVPALNPGASGNIHTVLTMPSGLIPGSKNIVFVVDRVDVVPEADEQNEYFSWVTVPNPGLIDCSTSVSLTDNVWYWDNTQTSGVNNVEDYWSATDLTAPEIVHSFIAPYSGQAKLWFSEKIPGQMNCMAYPVCNENTWLSSVWFSNITDTIAFTNFYVNAGTEYFVVVDSKLPIQGDYGVKIELPSECPELDLEYWGDTTLCDGDSYPGFWTDWGYSNYQWFKDGVIIPDQTWSSYSSTEPGTYHVEVNENGCVGVSEAITVSMSFPPDTAIIINAGALEFCDGGSVLLQLDNTIAYPLQWTLNSEIIPGEISDTYTATETGMYKLLTTNGSCSIESNALNVDVNGLPVDIGESTPYPSDTAEFFYSFTEDNYDDINNYQFNCWDFLPTDDRNSNFWQARDFSDLDIFGYSSHYYALPDDFTLAFWFKTTTTEGGVMASFVNSPWGVTSQDLVAYMSNDGKVHFWVSNGGTPAELTSVDSYNDGNWHSVLITHEVGMLMEIDNGDEFLQIGTPLTHLNFSGYWVFAGPAVPATVSSVPTSPYFNGSIDDLLCINESNYLLRNYIDEVPKLNISVIGDTVLCDSGLAYFEIENSQNNIEYKVWNNTLLAWHPLSGIGTGAEISVGGTLINQTTEFLFYAVDPVTLCETLLDTSITISVYPSLAPSITVTSDGVNPLCAGDEVNFTAHVTDAGANPSFEWYVNGVQQFVDSEYFTYNYFVSTDSIEAIVYSNYYCPAALSALSDKTGFDVLPVLTPTVSLSGSPSGTICSYTNVNFTATPVDCGTSPTYEWFINGSSIGFGSDTFIGMDWIDSDEVHVVVTPSYLCPATATAVSNVITISVSATPQASMSVAGGNCIGQEVCLIYNGETAGLVSTEWEIWDGSMLYFSGPGPHCFIPVTANPQIAVFSQGVDGCLDSVTVILAITESLPDINIYDTIYRCPGSVASYTAPGGYDFYEWSNGIFTDFFQTTVAGLYYLTVSNAGGCFDVDSLLVEDYEDNGFNWPEDSTICIDATLLLNTEYSYSSYHWFVGTLHEYFVDEISVVYEGENPIEVALYAEDDHCQYIDTMNVHFETCGFVDNPELSNVRVYPNPSSETVFFESTDQIQSLIVFDVTGKLIFYTDEIHTVVELDISKWAYGEYYYQLTTLTQKTMKSKFVKIK